MHRDFLHSLSFIILITPSRLEYAATHLARNHNRITKEERIRVQRYINGLEDVAGNVLDVRFLAPEDPPYGEIVV
jgi:hypothetical protein